MNFYITTVAILSVGLTVRETEGSYKGLNDYLVKNVDSDEVGPNMEAAIGWLQEQQSVGQTNLREMNMFTALQQVMEDSKCGREAFEIKRENEQSVNLHKLLEHERVLRRVEKVMAKIFKDHARRCSKVYLDRYRAKTRELSPYFAQVENISRPIMNVEIHNPVTLFFEYLDYRPTLRSFANDNAVVQALVSNAREDPDFKNGLETMNARTGKASVNYENLKQLANKYLIEPCLRFMDDFGPDVFVPARFDCEDYLEVDKKEQEYFLGWSYYLICQAYTNNKKAVFDSVARSAKNNILGSHD